MKPPPRHFRCAILASVPALASLMSSATAQVPDALKVTFSPTPSLQTEGRLGLSVAQGGGYVAAGVPYDDAEVSDCGSVKVFDAATGALLRVIPNPTPLTGENFGRNIAMSGTRLVVAVPEDAPNGIITGAVCVYDLAGSNPTVPVWTLTAPSPLGNDQFGKAVAFSGSRLFVSAGRTGPMNRGSVFAYDLDGATPTIPTLILENSAPELLTSYGDTLAAEGSRLVVSSLARISTFGIGTVQVYELANANPTVPAFTLNHPTPFKADYFGQALGISGTRIVVGAPLDNPETDNAGRAYVYDLVGATPTEPILTLPNPSPGANVRYGQTVGISGTLVLVGAPYQTNAGGGLGNVYAYDLASANPIASVFLPINPDPGAGGLFGFGMAISGNDLIVGAPYDNSVASEAGSAYRYDLAGAAPTTALAKFNAPGLVTQTRFGENVALSGSRLAVTGQHNPHNEWPRVLVYDLAGNNPTVPEFTLTPDNPYFGTSLSIDGSILAVGNPIYEGATGLTYCYDLGGLTPNSPQFVIVNPAPPTGPDTLFGMSVSVSGTRVAVGAPTAGWNLNPSRVDVFDLASPTPASPVATLINPTPSFAFGYRVSMSGTRIVVPDTNSVYVFDLTNATPAQPVLTLSSPSAGTGDGFGQAAAVSESLVVVGAPATAIAGVPGAGCAYVYDLTTAAPAIPTLVLNHPNPNTDAWFGATVSISGSRIAISAPNDSSGALKAGIVYVFDLASPTPTLPVATLRNPQPNVRDNFAQSLAVDGATIAAGVPFDDDPTPDHGTVYVFGPSPFSLWKHNVLGDDFASDSDDGDGDGGNNLLEYSLLLNPAASDATLLSQSSVYDYPDGSRLRIFVPRDPAHSDLTVQVQAADSPAGPWTALATSTTGAPFTGPGYVSGDGNTPGVKTVEVRDTVPMSSATQRFMRVKVMH